MAVAAGKALVLLMAGQQKMQSWATAGDPKGDISCRFICSYLENTELKAKVCSKVVCSKILFCFGYLS